MIRLAAAVRCDRPGCTAVGPEACDTPSARVAAELAGWLLARESVAGLDLCPTCKAGDEQRVRGGRE